LTEERLFLDITGDLIPKVNYQEILALWLLLRGKNPLIEFASKEKRSVEQALPFEYEIIIFIPKSKTKSMRSFQN
jgi:hypothetical protein